MLPRSSLEPQPAIRLAGVSALSLEPAETPQPSKVLLPAPTGTPRRSAVAPLPNTASFSAISRTSSATVPRPARRTPRSPSKVWTPGAVVQTTTTVAAVSLQFNVNAAVGDAAAVSPRSPLSANGGGSPVKAASVLQASLSPRKGASPPTTPRSRPAASTSPSAAAATGGNAATSLVLASFPNLRVDPFAVRPTIAPSAFYDTFGFSSSPELASPARSPMAAADLVGPPPPDGDWVHLQEDGTPADAAAEAEKAKMATLLQEMAVSVSHVALRDLFHTLQRDGGHESGDLSAEELSDLARVGHVQLTDDELAEVMSQMDVNENGRVSMDEFR